MSRNPEAIEINSTHADYSTIYTRWVEQGQPSRFDRWGSFGGAIYTVRRSGDNVTFYQVAALGPTLFADDTASGHPYQEGWWHLNRNYMRLKARWTPLGRIVIRRPVIPNEQV